MSAASNCPNCGLPRFWGVAGYVGAQCSCGQFSPHGAPERTVPPIWQTRPSRFLRPIVPVEPEDNPKPVVTKACLRQMLNQRGAMSIHGDNLVISVVQLHDLLRDLGVNLE